jgi:N-acyl-L-homoserine lactone synthetase
MIRILTNADRAAEPALFRQMYAGRAAIFHDRLNWEVKVVDGLEIDRYDDMDQTVYIVALDDTGRVTGSLRLLQTTSETMMQNEFANFFDEPVDVVSPTIIECTRFCVHPSRPGARLDAQRRVSSELLIGLCNLCLNSGFEHVLGLYDARAEGVYRRIGWTSDVLTESVTHRGHLRVGLWEASPEALANMTAIADAHRDQTDLPMAA